MNKAVIEIWDSVGLGIIVQYNTGVYFSNQTGGSNCLHPKIEGFYLPLCNDYNKDLKFLSPEIELSEYFEKKYKGYGAIDGIDDEDINFINNILKNYKLDEFIRLDLNKRINSHEAWIYVLISNNDKNYLINNLNESELEGVLVWSNSD